MIQNYIFNVKSCDYQQRYQNLQTHFKIIRFLLQDFVSISFGK